jgi:competence protein ComEC
LAAKGKDKKINTKKTAAYIVIIALIFITIAEGLGYDPIGFIEGWTGSSKTGGTADDVLTVNFIDVGQGDCIYISAGDDNMLIDCGEASAFSSVSEYLDELGVTDIEYVVGTHPHSDHMGGMSSVVTTYNVGEFIMPYLPDSDIPTTRYFEKFMNACAEKNLSITDAEVGRVINIGDATAEIIAPNSQKYNNTNNYSVGILITHGSNTFLFTGDAESSAEQEMIDGGKLEHINVYKAGHHGSSTSSTAAFLEQISPDYAVVMCGDGNSYGHPHQEFLDRISVYTDKIYRTDSYGNIVFTSDGTNLTVDTERGAA